MKDEEIDLLQIYTSFKKSVFLKKLNLLLNFVLSNKFWFLLLFILGIGTGYFLRENKTPTYKSFMLVKSKYLNNKSVAELINSLKILLAEKNNEELRKIGFNDEIIRSIEKIEFEYPYEINDSLLKVEPFKINVYHKENQLCYSLEKALYKFLSNNPASLANENIRKKALINELEELSKKLHDLDELHLRIYKFFDLKREQLKDLSIIVDPAAALKERRETFSKITKLNKELNEINNFEIIIKMAPRKLPEKVGYFKMIAITFLFIIFGGYFLYFIKNRKAKK